MTYIIILYNKQIFLPNRNYEKTTQKTPNIYSTSELYIFILILERDFFDKKGI